MDVLTWRNIDREVLALFIDISATGGEASIQMQSSI